MKRTGAFIKVIILLFLCLNNETFAQDGEKLFKGNCGVCHSIGKGKLVGPDLKGVDARHEQTWLLKWIKSSQSLVKSGDKKAVQIFNENGGLVMPDQALTEDEIKLVLAFVKTKEQQQAEANASQAKTPAASVKAISSNNGSQANDSSLLGLGFSGYIMVILIGILLIVIWVMGMSIRKLSADINTNSKNPNYV